MRTNQRTLVILFALLVETASLSLKTRQEELRVKNAAITLDEDTGDVVIEMGGQPSLKIGSSGDKNNPIYDILDQVCHDKMSGCFAGTDDARSQNECGCTCSEVGLAVEAGKPLRDIIEQRIPDCIGKSLILTCHDQDQEQEIDVDHDDKLSAKELGRCFGRWTRTTCRKLRPSERAEEEARQAEEDARQDLVELKENYEKAKKCTFTTDCGYRSFEQMPRKLQEAFVMVHPCHVDVKNIVAAAGCEPTFACVGDFLAYNGAEYLALYGSVEEDETCYEVAGYQEQDPGKLPDCSTNGKLCQACTHNTDHPAYQSTHKRFFSRKCEQINGAYMMSTCSWGARGSAPGCANANFGQIDKAALATHLGKRNSSDVSESGHMFVEAEDTAKKHGVVIPQEYWDYINRM